MQPENRFRTDIQALRGFAVLVVLLYHARLGLVPAGFLGVDVFFVLSGFLITRLIADELAAGRFSFAGFYFRRARRLLPAAYVTFLGTVLLAPFLLTSSELLDFRDQLAGAVTFTANIVLWQQSRYFSGEAELKPLLHVWSLAIEEQYYFLLPALLVLVPRRQWLPLAAFACALSLALCVWIAGKGSAAFYLLPARAWELGLGSLGALLARDPRLAGPVRTMFWPALAILLALPMLPLRSFHPGPVALAICLATLVVILRRHPVLFQGVVSKPMSWLGNISYSLYLVHWPLFAFANNLWFREGDSESPLALRLGLIVLALMLAVLLNRYVEEPLRYRPVAQRGRAVGLAVGGAALLVLLVSAAVAWRPAERDYAALREANHGFGISCDSQSRFEARPECRNVADPQVLVWGDSYAMQLVPGLVAGPAPLPLVQATRSVCGPLLGVALLQEAGGYGAAWARSCMEFNDSVLDWLAATPSVHTVVISSPFTPYVDPGKRLLRREKDGHYRELAAGQEEGVAGLRRTVAAVRALGRRIVVVAPPPSTGFDTSRCLERVGSGMAVMGVASDCSINEAVFRDHQAPVLALLDALPSQAGVGVMRFDNALCRDGRCVTRLGDTLLYRDPGHLSREGAVRLARDMDWRGQLQALAR